MGSRRLHRDIIKTPVMDPSREARFLENLRQTIWVKILAPLHVQLGINAIHTAVNQEWRQILVIRPLLRVPEESLQTRFLHSHKY